MSEFSTARDKLLNWWEYFSWSKDPDPSTRDLKDESAFTDEYVADENPNTAQPAEEDSRGRRLAHPPCSATSVV